MGNKEILPGISHYNLHFIIQPENGIFNASGTLTIKNEWSEVYNELPLLLYHELRINSISDNNSKSLHFVQEKVRLEDDENYYVNYISVKLPDSLKQNKQINLNVEYEGSINGYAHIMQYVKDKIDREFSIIRPDCHTYPIIAQPRSESILRSYKNTFTYDITVDVPDGYSAGCGGMLENAEHEDSRKIFKYKSAAPTWRFDIGIARYSILENKDINLRMFVFSEHKINAETFVKDEIKRAFEFFTSVFGDYPENSYFTVVEIKESYGSQAGDNYIMMEEHGFTSESGRLTHLYHEIGHAWNAKAKNNVQRSRFFDEAFASFFEALVIRDFYGDKAYRDKMEMYREYFIRDVERDKINYDTPICDYGGLEIGHNSYSKGPWALYVLNEIAGDDKFYKIIREFLFRYKHKEVDFKDFQETAQEVADMDLGRYFEQWIYGMESSKFLLDGIGIADMVKKCNY